MLLDSPLVASFADGKWVSSLVDSLPLLMSDASVCSGNARRAVQASPLESEVDFQGLLLDFGVAQACCLSVHVDGHTCVSFGDQFEYLRRQSLR